MGDKPLAAKVRYDGPGGGHPTFRRPLHFRLGSRGTPRAASVPTTRTRGGGVSSAETSRARPASAKVRPKKDGWTTRKKRGKREVPGQEKEGTGHKMVLQVAATGVPPGPAATTPPAAPTAPAISAVSADTVMRLPGGVGPRPANMPRGGVDIWGKRKKKRENTTTMGEARDPTDMPGC